MENDFDYRILSDYAFGLIDPSALYDLPAGIVGEPMVPSDLAASAHLMPRLLNFRALSEDSTHVLLESFYDAHISGQAPPIRVLVETEASVEQFTRHWNGQQLVSSRPGVQSWLRLHDPRVLHQLMRILRRGQRDALFGKSSALTYWIGDEWIRVGGRDGESGEQSVSLPGLYDGPANWDWPRIEQIGIINRALEAAKVSTPSAMHSEAAIAEQLISRAQTVHGLTDKGDLVEFVTRGLSTSPTFDQHPKIAAMMIPPDDPADDSSLSDRLALIDEKIWNELRQQTGANLTQLGTP